MSEVAHGNRARKMEKRRIELLNSVNEAIQAGAKLRPYKGDASLRDAFKDYWMVLNTIFKEDYHKIVDMEEVAEQSYDEMEAYLLIQEKAGQKLHEAYRKIPACVRRICCPSQRPAFGRTVHKTFSTIGPRRKS